MNSNPVLDSIFKITTPLALVFVGVSIFMAIPKVERLTKTLDTIHADARHFAENPVPIALQTGEAAAKGVLNAMSEQSRAVGESDLGKQAGEAASKAANAASGLLNGILNGKREPDAAGSPDNPPNR
jgi:hypothetical protein